MTYAILATNPKTKEVGIALCTITLNAGRITPLHHVVYDIVDAQA